MSVERQPLPCANSPAMRSLLRSHGEMTEDEVEAGQARTAPSEGSKGTTQPSDCDLTPLLLLLVALLAAVATWLYYAPPTSGYLDAWRFHTHAATDESTAAPYVCPASVAADAPSPLDPSSLSTRAVLRLLNGSVPANVSERFGLPISSSQRGTVCISTSGRFGNWLYQVWMGVAYAARHSLSLHIMPNPWLDPTLMVVQALLSTCPANDTLYIDRGLDHQPLPDMAWFEADPLNGSTATSPPTQVTLHGYFQYSTAFFAPWEDKLRAVTAVGDERLLATLELVWRQLLKPLCAHALLVGVHVRRGDFVPASVGTVFRRLPLSVYTSLLRELQVNASALPPASLPLRQEQQQLAHWDESVLQRAKRLQDTECTAAVDEGRSFSPRNVTVLAFSEDAEVLTELRAAGYETLGVKEVLDRALGEWVSLPTSLTDYLLEWWLMTRLRVLATSHSSFSLSAAVMNRHSSRPQHESERRAFFYRPQPEPLSMQQFEPWDFWYDFTAMQHVQ